MLAPRPPCPGELRGTDALLPQRPHLPCSVESDVSESLLQTQPLLPCSVETDVSEVLLCQRLLLLPCLAGLGPTLLPYAQHGVVELDVTGTRARWLQRPLGCTVELTTVVHGSFEERVLRPGVGARVSLAAWSIEDARALSRRCKRSFRNRASRPQIQFLATATDRAAHVREQSQGPTWQRPEPAKRPVEAVLPPHDELCRAGLPPPVPGGPVTTSREPRARVLRSKSPSRRGMIAEFEPV